VLALGVVTAILAALAHPVSILLLGGPALWLLMSYVRPSQWNELWSRKSFRWGALAAVFIGLIIAARFVPILYGWITQHDQNPGSGQFLLRTPAAPGLKQILYVMAYLESLTFPVAIGAVVGAYLLWGERQRNLTIFLVSVAVFPIVFLALLSLRTAVSQYYLLPTAPAFFLAAGVFLDRVARIEWAVRPRWLLPAALTLIFVASAAPTLVSDLRDGRRFNFRGVALWLKPQLTPADIVFSDQYMVMAHYLPGADVRRLRATDSLEDAWQDLQRQARPGALWIVAPAPSHPFRTNLKRGGLINWIQLHCQLRYIRGVGRVDLRQHYLQVYRCPPIEPQQTDGEAAEGAETQ
jgi:hypothetical protein